MRLIGLPAFLLLALPPFTAARPDPAAELLKPSAPVLTFRIEVDKPGRDSLRREPRKYVTGTLRVGDQTFEDVAIHVKGAAGSFRAWDDRPCLTLNMNKLKKGQRFMGLDKFHLNNSVQDGTYLNEILSGEMALANGLPAARGTHVLVELNGRKVGLYVLKEGFDRTFLRRHFEQPDGNLYDGGFLADIDGELELDEGLANQREDLKKLVKACHEPIDKRFAALDKVLDVDRMITNAALQAICADWDGYCRNRNNYRVYFDPKSGKAVFLPHGLDQLFGNPHDAIWPGWGGLAARALLETPEGRKRYAARVKAMTSEHFTLAKWYKRIDEYVPRLQEAMERLEKGSSKHFENEIRAYKERLKQRADYLTREVPQLRRLAPGS